MVNFDDFIISNLGSCEIDSPLPPSSEPQEQGIQFIEKEERILLNDRISYLLNSSVPLDNLPSLEIAGPRKKIYFPPEKVRMAIVTCGGLCPGLNNVIRDLVMTSSYHYKVKNIIGFRYGYRGIAQGDFIELIPDQVSEIHEQGGSILASSRGIQDLAKMVDSLVKLGINILFVIGGDGSMHGALAIAGEIKRRNLKMSIIGIPKTIDNDFKYMDQSFGYATAASKAVEALNGAHREAQGAPNGIGLVKLMGRQSGFIACAATLASNQVNFVLIPEVPFRLEGPNGFLEVLRKRLESRKHALIVVAEGAGQDLLQNEYKETDASGNIKLKDIGIYLKEKIVEYFKSIKMEINLKYIDPSYIIRSVKASPYDSVLCTSLALNAVHAAMAGKTEMVIAMWHRRLVHIPIQQVIIERNQVDPKGPLWLSVLGATGQPLLFH
jgi:6-phosphofructokinase 1